MSNADSVAVVFQVLSGGTETELSDAVNELEEAGLKTSFHAYDPGPQAALEWLSVPALLLWVGDKFFGSMVSEEGKTLSKKVKDALAKIFDRTLKPAALVKRVRTRQGQVVEDSYFSGNLSFGYASPEGWQVKLMFPLDITAEQYHASCVAFAQLITDHARAPKTSPLEAEIELMADERASILPIEPGSALLRQGIRLLVFWRADKGMFYVPDPAQTAIRLRLVSRILGGAPDHAQGE